MPLSVIDPIQRAIDHTQKVLFGPFDFGKWLGLGFCSFLAMLGEGGGRNANMQNRIGGGPGGGGPDLQPVINWIEENVLLLVSIVAGVVIVSLAVWLLILWLSSRGRFMFLDGVVRDQGAVVDPWREFRREANSLLVFRIVLGIAGFLVMVLLLAACVLIAWSDIQADQFGGMAMTALFLGIFGILGFAVVMGVVELFLKDFVVPVMYLQRIPTIEAWRVFSNEMLQGNIGTFALYVLIKILLAIFLAFAGIALFCGTCCIAVIPYIGSVIFLPLTVFERSYSLFFIEQFGPEWKVFPDLAEAGESYRE